MGNVVNAWEETIILPTYETGKPEKNPIFLEKRVYQGSSGAVYPHPVIEKIHDEKVDKAYKAVFIENDFLKIMILPELGGRVHRAYDKIQKRDFIYYNRVIKPALVGLAGPWISGGIEFNWPQHHRPSTFQPVDYTIIENADGSKTVWVNEVEIMFRTKGRAGFTLYPDKAYLEISGKLYNRTPFPQTFLWWANPAVKVNEHYQSIFPPDVYAVFDHGKRDVSDFPIATGTYYKVNYAPGTDISRYKNIPVPTSYMAIQSKFDFIGCYEHDTQAGMLHVANHHISPGKKQWTWGNGDFGHAWDRNLTDEDGPYIELMTGMFTDNQPDFSWLQPGEEKTFEQYFMPYAKIGAVKNATKEAMVNLEVNNNEASIKVYATAQYNKAGIVVSIDKTEVKTFSFNLSPAHVFEEVVALPEDISAEQMHVAVYDAEGKLLVEYKPEKYPHKTIPPSAVAAKQPGDIETIEELYLNGLHLEQYRHATFNPLNYYKEGLRRDAGDMRCNNAVGLLLLRKGQFAEAEHYFKKAVERLTLRNPNPIEGEPYYNLGLSLLYQDRLDEAYNAFYKAIWNDAWQHVGFLSLARISAKKQDWSDVYYLANKSLLKNYNSHTVRHLLCAALRKQNKHTEAFLLIEESLSIDPFNYGCLFEKYLLLMQENKHDEAEDVLVSMKKLMHDFLHNYLEHALDYAHAGMYEEAAALLKVYTGKKEHTSPMAYYYLGWFSHKSGDKKIAAQYYQLAQQQNPAYCFPNKVEEVLILKDAIELNPHDAKANFYLGNFWYSVRNYTAAIDCWEKSVFLDDSFPTVHRNLSLAYHNKQHNTKKALSSLEKAFALDTTDARILMELDQLYKLNNKPYKDRLQLLEKHSELTDERDDLYLERITLYNQLGKYEKAKDLLAKRKFHPWEGGEGKTVGQFLITHINLAKKALQENRFKDALHLLNSTVHYPHNLGEGKLYGIQENDIHYLQGCAWEGLGRKEEATKKFVQATGGVSEPVQAIFYNDPQPDKIFYQGLAWLKLGNESKAKEIFERFISFGRQHINDEISIDYFAVSLPDLLVFDQDLNIKNKIHCKYLIALGHLGLADYESAENYFNEVLRLNINHQGAQEHKNMIAFLKQQDRVKIPANM